MIYFLSLPNLDSKTELGNSKANVINLLETFTFHRRKWRKTILYKEYLILFPKFPGTVLKLVM